MPAIRLGLTVAVSWYTALHFTRMPSATRVCCAGGIAAICGLVGFLIGSVLPVPIPFLADVLLFFMMSVLLKRLARLPGADVAATSLMAAAQFAMLYWLGTSWIGISTRTGLETTCIFVLVQLSIVLFLRKWAPKDGWAEYFAVAETNLKHPSLRPWQLCLMPLSLSLLFVACAVWVRLPTLADTAVITVLSLTLFWSVAALLIIIPVCQREHTFALLERQYRDDMHHFMNIIRSQRHDYNFHVQTLAGLIRRGNFTECRKYVEELEQDTQEINALLPIQDPSVSAAIHNFRLLASQDGIVIHFDIRYDLSQIATNSYETNKIIGNLLQNAIDETKKHRDKSTGILLNIIKRNEFCVIRVSNSLEELPSAKEIGRYYQQGYSTKQGHDGIGLSSIRIIAERYGGSIETQLEDCIIHFIARVPINTAKSRL